MVQIGPKNKKGREKYYSTSFFSSLLPFPPFSYHMYWNSVGERKLLKFAPRHLTPNNLSSKFLLLELAVLLLALNHDCQSCASSPTSEPKSSTNVFVSSQHTPPAATQFLWPHAQLRRLAFMRVGCRKQSRKQDRETGEKQRGRVMRLMLWLEAEELEKVEV